MIAGGSALLVLLILLNSYGGFLVRQLSLPLPELSISFGSSAPRVIRAAITGPAMLKIPKLSIEAPITPHVTIINQFDYDQVLNQGVALAEGTADLDATTGNSFIFGHSSSLSVSPTRYDTIFASLPGLQVGDTFQITTSKTTTYQVITSKAIKASEVQYLQSDGTRKVTLITCWPIGTNWKRWVIEAKRIDSNL